jgi:aminoglycoside 3-N-acetyltransferase I
MENNRISYKKLQVGNDSEFYELVLLFNKVFESTNPVNTENIHQLLKNPRFVCFAAFINHEIVGGITAYELEMYDQPGSAMYIYDLAVCKEHQRNGIGSRLVKEIIHYCKSKCIQDVFVQAEEADRHAVQFYRKIGGEPIKTYHFNL